MSLDGGDAKSLLKRNSTSSTLLANHVAKRQKVAPGATHPSGGRIVVAPEHAVYFAGKPAWTQIINSPAASDTALASTTYFSMVVENTYPGVIEDSVLRFRLTFTKGSLATDNSILPITQWFDRIEWYNRGTGQEIARYQGDILHLLMQTLSQEALKPLAELMNFDPKTGRPVCRQFTTATQHDFYLPLVHHWFDGLDLDYSELKHDMEIRFYPRGSIFRVPTAGNSVALNEIRMINGSSMLPSGLFRKVKMSKKGQVQQHNYIDYQRYTDTDHTMARSTEYMIDLDAFRHVSAGLIVTFRRNVRTDGPLGIATEGDFEYLSLGDGATIDHENVHGRSLMGMGTALPEEFFRMMGGAAELFNHEFLKHNCVYFIPFTADVSGMLGGEIDGFHNFVGDREKLVITTGGTVVDTTCTYDLVEQDTASSDGKVAGGGAFAEDDNGRVSLYYSGALIAETTYSGGDAATTLTLLEAKANASELLRSNDVQIAITETNPDALALINVTFTDLTGQPKIWNENETAASTDAIVDLAEKSCSEVGKFAFRLISSDETAGGVVSAMISRPGTYVPGKRGWGTAAISSIDVDIDVYSLYYRHLFNVDGRIEAHDD